MIRIGIICPSEIAFRRFLPALSKIPMFRFAGVAIADKTEWEGADDRTIEKEKEKAGTIIQEFGGKIFERYSQIIQSEEVDAIYVPLPPALHYFWAKQALIAGKHVLIEKPATVSLIQTHELVNLALNQNLALHENYMFVFHNQLKIIDDIIKNDSLGDIRLYRLAFGFPKRPQGDFRYNKQLGGGALLDCGGYTLKLASLLLGETAKIVNAHLHYTKDYDVDIFGSAEMVNKKGITAQLAFGMDNSYKCDLEVWGSKGYLTTGRIFTAPAGYNPEAVLKLHDKTENIKLPEDDAFEKSILHFQQCIADKTTREKTYNEIVKQGSLVNEFLEKASIFEPDL